MAGIMEIAARPESRYLVERARAGLLTADEEAQYVQLQELLDTPRELAAWAAGLLDADASQRPAFDRIVARVKRLIRHTRRLGHEQGG